MSSLILRDETAVGGLLWAAFLAACYLEWLIGVVDHTHLLWPRRRRTSWTSMTHHLLSGLRRS
jgi:hypothetical protein